MQHTIDSDEARTHWRDVLDASAKGVDTVITSHNKPVSVLINYDDYLALVEYLEDLRDARDAKAILETIRKDPSQVRPLREYIDELIARGELDPDFAAQQTSL